MDIIVFHNYFNKDDKLGKVCNGIYSQILGVGLVIRFCLTFLIEKMTLNPKITLLSFALWNSSLPSNGVAFRKKHEKNTFQ